MSIFVLFYPNLLIEHEFCPNAYLKLLIHLTITNTDKTQRIDFSIPDKFRTVKYILDSLKI